MLAVLVSMSVLRVLFLRVRSILLTPNCALIAVAVQAFVLHRLYTRDNSSAFSNLTGAALCKCPLCFYKMMKLLLHILAKSAIITAIGVVAYHIYMYIVA